jgi:transcriptional regulator with XRE-family HTH domain
VTSFDFEISAKDLAGAEHVTRVGRQLVAAFVRQARKEKITKAELARRLDLDKASISRMLRGNANLTLRSVGELCWAMGVRPDLTIVDDHEALNRSNEARIQVAPSVRLASLQTHQMQVRAQ